MRLWHNDLIPYLPKKQLMAMRYELGDMIKQYPNIKNGIVKFANNYDIEYLRNYFIRILIQFDKCEIKHNKIYDKKILQTCIDKSKSQFISYNLYFQEDNEEYLKICLWNLYEKYIRGLIAQDEWDIIDNNFGKYLK